MQRSLNSEILALSQSSSSDPSILVETLRNFQILTTNLETLHIYEIDVKSVHCNPFNSSQIAYLTENCLTLLGKKKLSFLNSGFDGFEFNFSPFLITFYNSSTIALKDMRQEKDVILYSGANIKQALPIDCCYHMAVLSNDLEIFDCRYWNSIHKYEHFTKNENWHIMTFPTRENMYVDGMVSETHQKLYGLGDNIEEYPHVQENILQEFIFELSSSNQKLPTIVNSIASLNIFPLLAAHPITIGNKEIFVQTSKNEGLFIESENFEVTVAETFYQSKLIYNREIETANFYDKKEFFQFLINENCCVPNSEKPKVLIDCEPEFEDFEDEHN